MKKRALELVDILEGSEVPTDTEIFEASDMLRRLVEELDRQSAQLEYYLLQVKRHADKIDQQQEELDKQEEAILVSINSAKGVGYVEGMRAVKTKPLSIEEVKKLMEVLPPVINTLTNDDLIEFAKAVEKEHGIK